MARGADEEVGGSLPPRRNPFRQEIADASPDYQRKRAAIREQMNDQALMERIQESSEKIEALLKSSFIDYQEEVGETYISINSESETSTLLNIQKTEQNYAAFLSEKLLEQIEDPYLQNRLDDVISEYQDQIIKPASLTRYGSKFSINERIFNRFLRRVQREILLYELTQDALEKEEAEKGK